MALTQISDLVGMVREFKKEEFVFCQSLELKWSAHIIKKFGYEKALKYANQGASCPCFADTMSCKGCKHRTIFSNQELCGCQAAMDFGYDLLLMDVPRLKAHIRGELG